MTAAGEVQGAPASVAQPPAYTGDLPSLAALNVRDARLERLLDDISEPWAMEFISEDEVIVTQIRGGIFRFHLRDRVRREISGLPAIATDKEQTGLLDVEVHPRYARNKRIYFSYVIADPETGRFYMTAVATALLDGEVLREVREILRAEPFGWSPANFGGALEFDDAGFLYVSIGDRSQHVLAQDGSRLEGKILRLNDDGSTPADNPFVDDPAVDDRIYALGVRNAQGLQFDPPSGLLLESEHGPMGGDEVNVIWPGRNYGWPLITYGLNYTTEPIGEGTHAPGLEQPLWYYLPSIAVSPMTVYRGVMFPEWEGHLLVGALKGQHVSKLDLDGKVVRSEQAMLGELGDRVRDVKVASDGSILVLTQNKGLFRLSRVPEGSPLSPEFDAELAYSFICAGCHDTGAGGAPLLSEPTQWQEVLTRSKSEIYRNTFEGKGSMPERGLCHICSDEQLRGLVDFMLERLTGSSLEP